MCIRDSASGHVLGDHYIYSVDIFDRVYSCTWRSVSAVSYTHLVKYEGDNGVQRIDVKVKRRGLTWKVDEADTFLSKRCV